VEELNKWFDVARSETLIGHPTPARVKFFDVEASCLPARWNSGRTGVGITILPLPPMRRR
jgi:hypothetical protein